MKLMLLMITMTMISCGVVERSCDMGGHNDLCGTLIGDEKISNNEYEKDQEELERFKQEVNETFAEIQLDLEYTRMDLDELRNEMNDNDQELFDAIQATRDDLQDAIDQLDQQNSSTLAVLRGFRRQINSLRQNIRIINNNINNLEVVCSYFYFRCIRLTRYCELRGQ